MVGRRARRLPLLAAVHVVPVERAAAVVRRRRPPQRDRCPARGGHRQPRGRAGQLRRHRRAAGARALPDAAAGGDRVAVGAARGHGGVLRGGGVRRDAQRQRAQVVARAAVAPVQGVAGQRRGARAARRRPAQQRLGLARLRRQARRGARRGRHLRHRRHLVRPVAAPVEPRGAHRVAVFGVPGDRVVAVARAVRQRHPVVVGRRARRLPLLAAVHVVPVERAAAVVRRRRPPQRDRCPARGGHRQPRGRAGQLRRHRRAAGARALPDAAAGGDRVAVGAARGHGGVLRGGGVRRDAQRQRAQVVARAAVAPVQGVAGQRRGARAARRRPAQQRLGLARLRRQARRGARRGRHLRHRRHLVRPVAAPVEPRGAHRVAVFGVPGDRVVAVARAVRQRHPVVVGRRARRLPLLAAVHVVPVERAAAVVRRRRPPQRDRCPARGGHRQPRGRAGQLRRHRRAAGARALPDAAAGGDRVAVGAARGHGGVLRGGGVRRDAQRQRAQVVARAAVAPVQGVAGQRRGARAARRRPAQQRLGLARLRRQARRGARRGRHLRHRRHLVRPVAAPVEPRGAHRVAVFGVPGDRVVAVARAVRQRHPVVVGRRARRLPLLAAVHVVPVERAAAVVRRRRPPQRDRCPARGGHRQPRGRAGQLRRHRRAAGARALPDAAAGGDRVAVGAARGHGGVLRGGGVRRDAQRQRAQVVARAAVAPVQGVAGQRRGARAARRRPAQQRLGLARLRRQARRGARRGRHLRHRRHLVRPVAAPVEPRGAHRVAVFGVPGDRVVAVARAVRQRHPVVVGRRARRLPLLAAVHVVPVERAAAVVRRRRPPQRDRCPARGGHRQPRGRAGQLRRHRRAAGARALPDAAAGGDRVAVGAARGHGGVLRGGGVRRDAQRQRAQVVARAAVAPVQGVAGQRRGARAARRRPAQQRLGLARLRRQARRGARRGRHLRHRRHLVRPVAAPVEPRGAHRVAVFGVPGDRVVAVARAVRQRHPVVVGRRARRLPLLAAVHVVPVERAAAVVRRRRPPQRDRCPARGGHRQPRGRAGQLRRHRRAAGARALPDAAAGGDRVAVGAARGHGGVLRGGGVRRDAQRQRAQVVARAAVAPVQGVAGQRRGARAARRRPAQQRLGLARLRRQARRGARRGRHLRHRRHLVRPVAAPVEPRGAHRVAVFGVPGDRVVAVARAVRQRHPVVVGRRARRLPLLAAVHVVPVERAAAVVRRRRPPQRDRCPARGGHRQPRGRAGQLRRHRRAAGARALPDAAAGGDRVAVGAARGHGGVLRGGGVRRDAQRQRAQVVARAAVAPVQGVAGQRRGARAARRRPAQQRLGLARLRRQARRGARRGRHLRHRRHLVRPVAAPVEPRGAHRVAVFGVPGDRVVAVARAVRQRHPVVVGRRARRLPLLAAVHVVPVERAAAVVRRRRPPQRDRCPARGGHRQPRGRAGQLRRHRRAAGARALPDAAAGGDRVAVGAARGHGGVLRGGGVRRDAQRQRAQVVARAAVAPVQGVAGQRRGARAARRRPAQQRLGLARLRRQARRGARRGRHLRHRRHLVRPVAAPVEREAPTA